LARRVLLVDPDLDLLGELSASLRSNGYNVVLADGAARGIERARETDPDVVVASADVCGPGELIDQLKSLPELSRIPSIVLVPSVGPGDELSPGQALHGDLKALMAKIAALPLRTVPVDTSHGEVRGDLAQVPLIDLLQILSMNRRTGALCVTTSLGAGEVRIADGEVLDAVYRRLEGEKALYRLLGEREGSFAFVPGGTVALRRVSVGTSMLVMEAMRQFDEVERLKKQLAPGGDVLLASVPVSPNAPRVERDVLALLQVPRSVDEVLDEVQAPDVDVLQVLEGLSARGVLRRIPRAALVTRLASDDRIQVLRAIITRLGREGFSGAARIAIAAPPHRLALLGGAILRIEDALAPLDPAPSAPVPHLLATLRLGEGVELAVIGLPTAAEFAPLWTLTLPGMGAVVRLDATDCPEFDLACAAAEVPVLHAAALLGEVEEGDPVQLAELLRLTLEAVAAG
jgi:CheY-like chemotaxis protein